MSTDLTTTETKPKRNYAVSASVQKALMALASGTAKTAKAAAEYAGMTDRGLRAALKRPSVQTWMREHIAETLGLGAVRAAHRMNELLGSENAMASFRAAQFALGAGAGVQMPASPGTSVQVNIGGQAVGYVLDLRDDPLTIDVAATAVGAKPVD